jgi:hypothetical protein
LAIVWGSMKGGLDLSLRKETFLQVGKFKKKKKKKENKRFCFKIISTEDYKNCHFYQAEV